MKVKSFILVACATVAMVFSSCGLRGLISSIEEITKEEEEILDGKLFTIAKGTITYEDGTVIMFEKNGQIQYRQDTKDGEIIIYDGETLYTIDPVAGTYTETEYANYYPAILADLYVTEAVYEFGDHLDKYSNDYKLTPGTMTIDGKNCKKYTITDGEDIDVIGSWNRVLVYSSNNDEVDIQAITIESSVEVSIMSILNNYTKAE